MEILKRSEAFKRAVAVFGPWSGWSRSQNLAYGLIRGVAYERMEKCANDDPMAFNPVYWLLKLEAWGKVPTDRKAYWEFETKAREEVKTLIQWVRKPVRVKKPRLPKTEAAVAAVG